MDAFEQLVSEILWMSGFWVRTPVKVELTKEEKRLIGRQSSRLRESRTDSTRRFAAPSFPRNVAPNSHTGLVRHRSLSSTEI